MNEILSLTWTVGIVSLRKTNCLSGHLPRIDPYCFVTWNDGYLKIYCTIRFNHQCSCNPVPSYVAAIYSLWSSSLKSLLKWKLTWYIITIIITSLVLTYNIPVNVCSASHSPYHFHFRVVIWRASLPDQWQSDVPFCRYPSVHIVIQV